MIGAKRKRNWKVLLIICDITIGLLAASTHLGLAGFPAKRILSGSMEPAISVDDVVLVSEHTDFCEIGPGDIIAYRTDGGLYVVHRVIEKQEDGLVTKGDRVEKQDGNPVTREAYAGKVIHIIRNGGRLYDMMDSAGFRILACILMILTVPWL